MPRTWELITRSSACVAIGPFCVIAESTPMAISRRVSWTRPRPREVRRRPRAAIAATDPDGFGLDAGRSRDERAALARGVGAASGDLAFVAAQRGDLAGPTRRGGRRFL